MGLFDRAKKAAGAAGAAGGDWAAQAQAAQQLASEQLRQAGYTDGSMPTMANAAEVGAQMQADHDVLNAYGQDLNRILQIGAPGTCVIVSAVDTGDRTAGQPWFQMEYDVTLPDQAAYRVSKIEMVPDVALANYAVGSVHEVRVDPADPQKIALAS